MQGSSRGALADAAAAVTSAIDGGADPARLGDELFGAAAAIDASAALRRALADPSGDAEAKKSLVGDLFSGKVGETTVAVLRSTVSGRWAAERDLVSAVEALGVDAVLAGAQAAGRLRTVEDELFTVERTVAGTPELRDALTNRHGSPVGKSRLVTELLEGKVAPQTLRLTQQAVSAPRGRKFDRIIEGYLAQAAQAHGQLTAVVTTAAELSEQHRERLVKALEQMYGKPVQLQPVIDPAVVGGVHIRIGDEVIDGTVDRRVTLARRGLTA